nr:hypothetical protein [uncultured Psychroserpens sp.]
MFNQRKNKRFSYNPHSNGLSKKKSENDLEAKWDEIRGNTKRKSGFLNSMPVLILILGAIFGLIYILNRYI